MILFAEHVFSYFSTFYVLDFTNGVWIGNQTDHIWRVEEDKNVNVKRCAWPIPEKVKTILATNKINGLRTATRARSVTILSSKATRYSASIMYDLPTYHHNHQSGSCVATIFFSNSSPSGSFLSLTYMHVVIQKGIFFLLPRLSLLNLLLYTKSILLIPP